MATAVISDKNRNITAKIENSNFSRTKIYGPRNLVTVNEILPFRIKLTNIGIPGYGASNVPGIGLQVIGFSNYIL